MTSSTTSSPDEAGRVYDREFVDSISEGDLPSKKRKREVAVFPEIEVNVDAPEPPSRKVLRRAKKGKSTIVKNRSPAPDPGELEASDVNLSVSRQEPGRKDQNQREPPPQTQTTEEKGSADDLKRRSEFGIWIGNLPWTANKDVVREFLISHAGVDDAEITRINLPAPHPKNAPNTGSQWKSQPAQNKGFAYVDFASLAGQQAVIGISETMMGGRRVLIKDSKSYAGRPAPQKNSQDESTNMNEDSIAEPTTHKPPSCRVFVGNLRFDVTADMLREHFAQCGAVSDAFVATFEDSGKCKGYGWVTFEHLQSAESSVRGFIFKDSEQDEAHTDEERKANQKRKWFVNQLQGQRMRVEFAEDSAFRYKKRFKQQHESMDSTQDNEAGNDIQGHRAYQTPPDATLEQLPGGHAETEGGRHAQHKPHNPAPANSYRKRDARTIKSGAALSKAMSERRNTGAIVPATGKKIVFD